MAVTCTPPYPSDGPFGRLPEWIHGLLTHSGYAIVLFMGFPGLSIMVSRPNQASSGCWVGQHLSDGLTGADD